MVRTSHGSVRGTRWGDTGGIFAGIPFAVPPIGPLRLRPPAPGTSTCGRSSPTPRRSAQPVHPRRLSPEWNRPPRLGPEPAAAPCGRRA
ncbi:carboxylesterase family protein [Streptomyces turgidiscabies]|nr:MULTISPECIES: carboxylesterase family protein [Streptomyces]MDX3491507.1 carboxylesterase family protein [Streptomyces turgidiscabies]